MIELLSFVHEQVQSGKSINAALKVAKKDRKTIDRFRNIYYLCILNNDKLKQVSYLYSSYRYMRELWVGVSI